MQTYILKFHHKIWQLDIGQMAESYRNNINRILHVFFAWQALPAMLTATALASASLRWSNASLTCLEDASVMDV